jgi:dipeptidyl aminopeptidase/acylaminoacyl peptidase
MTLEDLSLLRGVGDPQISPDDRWIAFVVTRTDYDANKSISEIHLVPATGGEHRLLVEGSSPRWSPDGKTLAYRARSDDQNGIWLYDISSRKTRFLVTVHSTDHFMGHRAVKNHEWSPDGQWIAFVGAEAPGAPAKSDVKVFSRILYKTRTSFSDNRRTHVWVVPVAGGEAHLLTPGEYDEHSISWSPDSQRIAFISNRSYDPDDNYRDDLWTVSVESGQVTRLTETIGTEFQPKWSPDGRNIAYLATVRELNTKDSPPEDTQIYVLAARGGKPLNLTKPLDRRISSISWHPDGEHIYFTASSEGAIPVYRVGMSTNKIEAVIQGKAQSRQYALDSQGKTMAYVRSDMTHPSEIWVANSDGSASRQLTHIGKAFTNEIDVQDAEMFWFESFDRTRVQGWLMRPVGFDSDKKYPLVLWVHGGPHGMYGYGFSDRFQALASQGYGVLFINPRGSSGYGQTFADGCVLNWGGGDYKDLMAGVDYALEHYPWLDEERLGVIGGSYGGFMTNWIVTQTDRFQAAVSVASVSNLISFYGTSLYQLLIEVEFNGKPWDNYALLWQWSPMNYVKNVRTPTLLLHGENDHDVPITQAEEFYIALKKLGIETVFVRYPGEGHGIRQPQHRLDYNQRILDWFDRFLKHPKRATTQ